MTYGAGGSTRDTTVRVTGRIAAETSLTPMGHLTCVGHTRAELVDLLEAYREQGVENVLALAGDPPKDGSDPGGDFVYATELVALAREVGDFSVGVAAYPDHGDSSELLIRAADQALYTAKHSGRNRVVVAP